MSASECYTCTKLTTIRCTGCKKAFFCSQLCQKMAWRTHKLHCQEIDSPIYIRQPAFTRLEYDFLMDFTVDDIDEPSDEPLRAWRGYTAVEKQLHRSTVDSLEEIERHQTLIQDRCAISDALRLANPDEASAQLNDTGLVPFYSFLNLQYSFGQGTQVYNTFCRLMFTYILLSEVKDDYREAAYSISRTIAIKLKEEGRKLERKGVEHLQVIKHFVDGLK